MATTVDLGKVRPVWKGAWSGSTAYEVHDMVKYGVNSYICTTAHTSDASTFSNDSANWDDLAQGANIPDQSGAAGLYLQSDGTNLSWQAAESSGRLLGIDVLGPWGSQSGTTLANNKQQSGATGTWTRPAGCNSVLVYVTGGGGGGVAAGDDQYRGMGGASGGTAIKFIQNVASTVSWTVGGGGNGSTSENGSGAGNGGTSSFGSYCSGYGGEHGRGSGGTHPFVAYGGGATGGDMNIPGGSPGFDHSSGYDGQGTVSFWGTHAGGRHRPSSDGLGNENYVQTGKWGSGGADGLYDYESANVANEISGGAGVIVIYKYS